MRRTIEINGIIADDFNIKTISAFLETVGVSSVSIKTLPQYDDWLDSLPKENIPGLKDACLDWIHHWGNGGGDLSSETCVTDAVKELKSDVPADIANAVYESVAGYCMTEFEAIGLTVELINECIEELHNQT